VALIVLYAGVALFAGFTEASNRATAGAYLLVGTILGAGLGFTGMEWQAALSVALGALWVFLVAYLMNVRLRRSNQRIALARAFDLLASVVDAIGTPQFFTAREGAVSALDRAQDIVGLYRRRPKNAEDVALRQCLIVALRMGEVISFLEGKDLPVDQRWRAGYARSRTSSTRRARGPPFKHSTTLLSVFGPQAGSTPW
jgi:uncharacterized membrane protein YccC